MGEVRFEPKRPASRRRAILALIVGPILWLVALAIVAWLLDYTQAIQLGLAVTIGSFVLSIPFLLVQRAGRQRRERRYVDPR
jgi:hypothetical protein